MDDTAYTRAGALSSKSGTMLGPDKQHGSPRLLRTASTGKKRLSMAEGSGPPPTNVTPYLAGPAVAAFCGQRASQKAELLQYLGKHKGAASRLLGSSTADNETDTANTIYSSGDGSYTGDDSYKISTAPSNSTQYSSNRGTYRPSSAYAGNSNKGSTVARASSASPDFRCSRTNSGQTSGQSNASQSLSPSQQRRSSVTAYLSGQQDLVTTALDGVPYVNSSNNRGGSPFDDMQQLYQQPFEQQRSGSGSLQRLDAAAMVQPAAAAVATRHSVVKDVIHQRISEAVARRSSSPGVAAAAAASSSPTRMHDEVSGVRHLLIDEGRARRASCNTLNDNSNANSNVTQQIFANSTGSSSSGLSPGSKAAAAAAALAKRISNAAIYPAAYEGLLVGQSDNLVDSGYNNAGVYGVGDPAVQGKSERVSVGDYSYGQDSSNRCSTMAAAAFMHMYDAQSDQQQQQPLDQIEHGHFSMTAAAAADRAAARDAAGGIDNDSSYSSSDGSEDHEQQQQQGQQRARTSKPRTRYNRGWSVASAAAARRRSSITPAAATARPSARAAAAAAARRASSLQADSSDSSRRTSASSSSSDGAEGIHDLAATGRGNITQGLLCRSSDSSSSSSSSSSGDDEPGSRSVRRLVSRARRSSAAGGLTARQQVRQRLLLRLKNRRSSSSSARSSSDDQGGFLARSGGSGARSAAAGKPWTSGTAAGSSARRSGSSSSVYSRPSGGRRASMAFLDASRVGVKPRGSRSISQDSDHAALNISAAAAARMKRSSCLTVTNQLNSTGRLTVSNRASKKQARPLKLKRNSSSHRRRIGSSTARRSSDDAFWAGCNRDGSSSSNGGLTRRLSAAIEVLLNPDDKPTHRLSLGHGAAAAIVMGSNSGAAQRSSSSRESRDRGSSKTAVGVRVGPKRYSVTKRLSSFKQQQQQQHRESVRDPGSRIGTGVSTAAGRGDRGTEAACRSSAAAAAAGSSAQQEAEWVTSISRRLSGVALHR